MIENNEVRIEEADPNEVEENPEKVRFPWTIAIIIGVLMLLIIACFIVVMVLGPVNPATSSSAI